MINIDREQLAWASGFFEGEGYVAAHLSIDRRAKSDKAKEQVYCHLCIEIGQVNEEPIHRLAKVFPGMGNVVGPYKNSRSDNYSIRFRTTKFEYAQAFLAMIWPWLSNKRKGQVKQALATFHEINSTRPKLKSGPKRARS